MTTVKTIVSTPPTAGLPRPVAKLCAELDKLQARHREVSAKAPKRQPFGIDPELDDAKRADHAKTGELVRKGSGGATAMNTTAVLLARAEVKHELDGLNAAIAVTSGDLVAEIGRHRDDLNRLDEERSTAAIKRYLAAIDELAAAVGACQAADAFHRFLTDVDSPTRRTAAAQYHELSAAEVAALSAAVLASQPHAELLSRLARRWPRR